MKPGASVLLGPCALPGAVRGAGARAQETAPTEVARTAIGDGSLEDVIATAKRREASLRNGPGTVGAAFREALVTEGVRPSMQPAA